MPQKNTDEAPQAPDLGHQPGTLPWLTAVVQRLLAPAGCPWDRKQTLTTLRAYLLEECYEVLDAIDEGNHAHHCEELGDLLFQIVFQAELSPFSLDAVIRGIGEKLIRRHPHVFGDATVRNAEEVKVNWEKLKAAERTRPGRPASALDGVPRAMPALQRGHQLVTRAARAGFDWPAVAGARAKVDEELGEVDAALAGGGDALASSGAADELGDVLLAVVGWARKLGIEPEAALRAANDRFDARFRYLEAELRASNRSLESCEINELLDGWRRAKAATRPARK